MLELIVEYQHKSGTNSSQSVGTSTLEHGGNTLVTEDLSSAVNGVLVDPLVTRLLRLHLESTSDSVEWVGSVTSHDGSELGYGELGDKSENTNILLVGILLTK